MATYDRIGVGYSRHRVPDPRWAATIRAAVGDDVSVLNVGAGAGSYEPAGLDLVAVEPSMEMVRQRPQDAGPVVRAVAEALPFPDASFDVALAVLTIHHWTDWRTGLAELRRVARRHVILTFDMDVVARTWLAADYLPEVIAFDRDRTPPVAAVAEELPAADVVPLHVPADMQDAVMLAHWNRPEAYLDAGVRGAASGFAQSPPEVVDRFVAELRRDLADGTWDRRHGHLRGRSEYDGGYRLVTTR